MNNVSIIGRLGQDPELRFTSGGKPFTAFSVAVDNPFRDDNEPDWVNVETWGKTAELVAEHKSKGDQVAITGRLTSSSWELSNNFSLWRNSRSKPLVPFHDQPMVSMHPSRSRRHFFHRATVGLEPNSASL